MVKDRCGTKVSPRLRTFESEVKERDKNLVGNYYGKIEDFLELVWEAKDYKF